MSPLGGRRILVTRPAARADRLARRIEAAGGEAVCFPTVAILPPADPAPVEALVARLEEFDLAVFVSPTSVEEGLRFIRARREWPARVAVAAVGQGSASTLREQGFATVLAPAEGGNDSEALLALPDLADMTGRRVLIVRGKGGRELLADTLVRRGATVAYAECYRRGLPEDDPAPLRQRLAAGEIAAVTATSGEALRNLFALAGEIGQDWLKKTPHFVLHPRIAETARSLGVTEAIVAGPGDDELVAGLVTWFGRHDGHRTAAG